MRDEAGPIAAVAPALLSTMIEVPNAAPSFCATRRPMMSVVPPAGYGTT
jgi:hypothetical protein